MNLMTALDGNGTYLAGLAMIAMGVVQLMGYVEPETLDGAGGQLGDPGMLIAMGIGIIRLRMGAKKAEMAAKNNGDGA